MEEEEEEEAGAKRQRAPLGWAGLGNGPPRKRRIMAIMSPCVSFV